MALLYGATGHLDYEGLRAGFDPANRLAAAGLALLLAGLLFKVAIVPFHGWAPDVFEGAPTPISGFMSTLLPTTVFFLLLRLFNLALPSGLEPVQPLLSVLAILCMGMGSFMALTQRNLKRMLAYSAIAHSGFLLAGFSIGMPEARGSVVFYLISFVFMNLGAFGAIAALTRGGREVEGLADFRGLAESHPVLAAAMAFFMLALAGTPGTAGFMAKFAILRGTLNGDAPGLGAAIIVTSVVLFASYIRLPTLMYMREGSPDEGGSAPLSSILALACCAAVVLYLGVFPGRGPFGLDVLELMARVAN